MAFEAIQTKFSAPAAVDLTTKQFYAVSYDVNGNINLATPAKNIDGILQSKPRLGEAADFCKDGYSKAAITAGVAIVMAGLLEVDVGGTLHPLAAGTAVAKALEAVAAGGAAVTIISVELLRSNTGF
jgi:hypothetical protein